MKTLLVIAFVAALIGLVTSLVVFFSLVFKRKPSYNPEMLEESAYSV